MRILFLFPQGSADTKENESNTLREKGFEFQKPRTRGINKRFGIKCDPSESVFPESSVQFSRSVMSDSLEPHGLQHARPPCPSPVPRAYSNSCPSSRWCHPTISSSVIRFSSCPQSFPASGSFQTSQLFTSGGQRIGVSASTRELNKVFPSWGKGKKSGMRNLWLSARSLAPVPAQINPGLVSQESPRALPHARRPQKSSKTTDSPQPAAQEQ